jgi:hypothetical protein
MAASHFAQRSSCRGECRCTSIRRVCPVWMASALQEKMHGCAAGQYSPVSGLWSRHCLVPLALMGSANLVPIGNANLKVQDKARVPRLSDDRTCHHNIRLAIPMCFFGLMPQLGGNTYLL